MPVKYDWPTEQMLAWYAAGYTIEEIAEKLVDLVDQYGNYHRPTTGGVGKRLRRLGCRMRKTGATGERNRSWNGGRHIDPDGYVWLWRPEHPDATKNGYVQEHRLVMEKKIGRRLSKVEVVHHKDDNRQNNRSANLVLYPNNGEHLRATLKGKRPKWSEAGYRRICRTLARNRKRQAAKRLTG